MDSTILLSLIFLRKISLAQNRTILIQTRCGAYKNENLNIKETFLILLILTIAGCKNYKKNGNLLVQKEFGNGGKTMTV